MKTLLIASLCSFTLVLNSFGQESTATSADRPECARRQSSGTAATPAPASPCPGRPGMTPADCPASPRDDARPVHRPRRLHAALACSYRGRHPCPRRPGRHPGIFLVDNFIKGGYIMWPILIVSIIAIAVVLERIFWWLVRWMRRDPKRIEKVFTAIEIGDVAEASRLSRGSRDPVLRMMWNGLNHQHASLQGALQVAAGIEIKRAGRFLVVMDTLVTLAPLLGLLGTITGLMKSFSFLGNEELAVQAVPAVSRKRSSRPRPVSASRSSR